MQYFGESARGLVGRALRLAQEYGAAELLPEHLLAAGDAQRLERIGFGGFHVRLIRAGPTRQLPEFGSRVLSLFEQAYTVAEGLVEELHLLVSLNWQEIPLVGDVPRLGELFTEDVLATLRARGVRVHQLLAAMGDVGLPSILPEPIFWWTPGGRRVLDLISAITCPAACSILLTLMLRTGPHQETLVRCGLTEPMLIQILTHFSQDCVDDLLASIDLDEPDLSRVGQLAFAIAWNCAERKVLGMQNLLDGLLCADMLCQPGEGATRILHNLKVVGFAHAATHQVIHRLDQEPREVALAPEVRRALEAAREVAAGGPISTEHLLYGLSRAGMSELRTLSITPERIQLNF